MRKRTRLIPLALAVVFTVALAAPAAAREGVYVGIGVANQTVSGDLDGSSVVITPDGQRSLRLPELDKGSGVALEAGYALGPILAVEYLYVSTAHSGTFTDSNGNTASHDARLNSHLVGVRANFATSDAFELFVRGGLAGHSLRLSNDAFNGSQATPVGQASLGSSRLTGWGTYYGLGVAMGGDVLGVELASQYQSAQLDRVDQGDLNSELDPTVKISALTYTLVLTYRFN